MSCFNKNTPFYKNINSRFDYNEIKTEYYLNKFLNDPVNKDLELNEVNFKDWYTKELLLNDDIQNSLNLENNIKRSLNILNPSDNQNTLNVETLDGKNLTINKEEIISYGTEVGEINYVKNELGDLIMLKNKLKQVSNNFPTPFAQSNSNSLNPKERIQSYKDGIAWLLKRFPGVKYEITQGLIDNIADGRYEISRDMIKLSEEYATKETIKEEAFHKAFHSLTTRRTREKLFDEGSKRFKIKRGSREADILIEEKIAELSRTAKDEAVKTTTIGKFFQNLINLLRNLFQEKSAIEQFIRNVEQARFELFPTERKPDIEEGDFDYRYSVFSKFSENMKKAYNDKILNPEHIKPGSVSVNHRVITDLNSIFIDNLKRYKGFLRGQMSKAAIKEVKASFKKEYDYTQKIIDTFEKNVEENVANHIMYYISNFSLRNIEDMTPSNKPLTNEVFIKANSYLNVLGEILDEMAIQFETSDEYKKLDEEGALLKKSDGTIIDLDTIPLEEEGNFSSKKHYHNTFNNLRGAIQNKKDELNQRLSNYLNKELIQEGYQPILDEKGALKAVKDIDAISENVLSNRVLNSHPLLSKANRMMQKSLANIKIQETVFIRENSEKIKALKKHLGQKGEEIYDRFIEKDSTGKKTKYIIREDNIEYHDLMSKAHEDSVKDGNKLPLLRFFAENSDITVNDTDLEKFLNNAEEKLTEYYKNQGKNNDEIETIIFNKKSKIKKDIKAFLHLIERLKKDPLSKNTSDGLLAYHNLRSSFLFKNNRINNEDVLPISIKGKSKFKNAEYKRLMSLPEGNPEKEFFIHLKKSLSKFWTNTQLPGTYTDYSLIPDMRIDKTTFEEFKSLFTDFAYNASDKKTQYKDIATGDEKFRIPLYMTRDILDIEEKSFDLGKVLENFSREAISYKVKSDLENDLLLYNEVLKSVKTFKVDFKGNPIKNKDGIIKTENMEASNLYSVLKYRMDNMIYGVKNTGDIAWNFKYDKEDELKINKLNEEISLSKLPENIKDKIKYSVERGDIYEYSNETEKEFYDKYKQLHYLIENKMKVATVGNIMNKLMNYTSFRFLYLNPFSGIAELMQGLSVLSLMSVSNRYMKEPDLWNSFWSNAKTLFNKDHKNNKLADLYGAISDDILAEGGNFKNKVLKAGFFMYTTANKMVNVPILISHLKNTIVKDLNGKEHKLYDVVSIHNNKMVLPDTFNQELLYHKDGSPTEFLTDNVVRYESILREYRDRRKTNDAIKGDGNALIRLLGHFKFGWLINGLILRWGGYVEATPNNPETKGFYRVILSSIAPKLIDPITGQTRRNLNPGAIIGGLAKTLVTLYKHSRLGKLMGQKEDMELKEYERDAFKMFNREMTIILTLFVAASLLRLVKDDDDEKNGPLLLTTNMALRLLRDASTYSSPNSLLSFFENPIPTLSTVKDASNLLFSIPNAIFNFKFNSDENLGEKTINKVISLSPALRQIKSIKTQAERVYGEI